VPDVLRAEGVKATNTPNKPEGTKQSGDHESKIAQKGLQETNPENKVTSEHENVIQFSGKKQSWTTDLTPYTKSLSTGQKIAKGCQERVS
jgi:hypothetical protein